MVRAGRVGALGPFLQLFVSIDFLEAWGVVFSGTSKREHRGRNLSLTCKCPCCSSQATIKLTTDKVLSYSKCSDLSVAQSGCRR